MNILLPHTKQPAFTDGTLVWLDGDDAYWRMFTDLWANPRTVIVVEHDITPDAAALDDLWACAQGWCTQPYPYAGSTYHGLGCVKFTAAFMEATPNLWDEVSRMSDSTHPPKHWCRLDAWSQIVLQRQGHTMHQHDRRVGHPATRPAHGCQ